MEQVCPRDCPNRSATCHGECEKYAAFYARNAEKRKQRQEEKNLEYAMSKGTRRGRAINHQYNKG